MIDVIINASFCAQNIKSYQSQGVLKALLTLWDDPIKQNVVNTEYVFYGPSFFLVMMKMVDFQHDHTIFSCLTTDA